MSVKDEFLQHANTYQKHNIIQRKVIKRLVDTIKSQPKTILDIGCGTGELYRSIGWPIDQFIAVDFASGMLSLHPRCSNVTLLPIDFNQSGCFDTLQKIYFDRIISASALQWAADLEWTLRQIAAFKRPVSLAIFTSGTFKTLHETANVAPLLRTSAKVIALVAAIFEGLSEVIQYSLDFTSTDEMLRYIKQSGVSGHRNVLNYRQTKQLIKNYPLSYLEFEVVFLCQLDRRL